MDGAMGATCWANGFKSVCSAPTTVFCTYTLNGAPCAVNALTTELGAYPAVYVYEGAGGVQLGTLTINSDHSQIAACADGSADVLPPSCWHVGAPCADGTCP
jgi:hypothetical protein